MVDPVPSLFESDDLLSPFFPGGVSVQHRAHVTVG
jgi:hypothetical protein